VLSFYTFGEFLLKNYPLFHIAGISNFNNILYEKFNQYMHKIAFLINLELNQIDP